MNEQTRKHLAELNHLATSPSMVAGVQYDEASKEAVVLFGNQTLGDGDVLTYEGKQYSVHVVIKDLGDVPDEPDFTRVERYISTEAWDKRAKTIVTTSAPVYATRPGRTVYHADITLSIGGKNIPMDNGGLGSRVVCTANGAL